MPKKTLEDLIANRSFVLWIKDEGSAEVNEYWSIWLRKDPEHQVLVEEARELMAAFTAGNKGPNSRVELEKLEHAIAQSEHSRSHLQISRYKLLYRNSRKAVAAGILLFLIGLAGLLAYQDNPVESADSNITGVTPTQEYATTYGEKVIYRLSDGSRITLNANSQLKFSSTMEKGLNTEVWLQGEAYFNIAHLEGEQQRRFTVHTKAGSIQVLGTKFVVKTFDAETRTVLEEGKIRVHLEEDVEGAADEYTLKPGNLARFGATDNKITVKEVNTQIFTSWIEDKLVFENTPLKDVADRIEDTFGVAVIVNEELSDKHLTGSIKSTDLGVLTEALSQILKTKITKRGRNVYIGTDD